MGGWRWHLSSPSLVAGVGTRLVDAEIDDDRTGEKDAPTHRLGQREAAQLFKQCQLRGFGRDGRQVQRRQRIESVAMLSQVAKLRLVRLGRRSTARHVAPWAGASPSAPTLEALELAV